MKQSLDQSTFSGTVLAHNTEVGAGFQGKVDIGQDRDALVGEGDITAGK